MLFGMTHGAPDEDTLGCFVASRVIYFTFVLHVTKVYQHAMLPRLFSPSRPVTLSLSQNYTIDFVVVVVVEREE